ncbi:Cysteine and glycine-rich protein 2 [Exaiptasia diaphana]|nr:Cysteine and glycine-rich protein 2 [Exaiptasia diaphana]
MADVCPRCSTKAYHAESVIMEGQNWHKRCFACKDCKKRLDSTTCAPHQGEVYCKSCHGKNYGPKGYGFGGGAGALTRTE